MHSFIQLYNDINMYMNRIINKFKDVYNTYPILIRHSSQVRSVCYGADKGAVCSLGKHRSATDVTSCEEILKRSGPHFVRRAFVRRQKKKRVEGVNVYGDLTTGFPRSRMPLLTHNGRRLSSLRNFYLDFISPSVAAILSAFTAW